MASNTIVRVVQGHTKVDMAGPGAQLAMAAAERAETAASSAEMSADAALVVSHLYPDTATGLAAVAEGAYFAVAGTGNTYATTYRKESGVAVAKESWPSKAGLEGGTGAGLIGYLRTATGAILRSALDIFDDQLSVMDFIPFAERVKIRLRTATADHSAYIQAAIDHSAVRGQRLKAPAGTYNAKNLTVSHNYWQIEGDGGQATLFNVDTAGAIGLLVKGRYGSMRGMGFRGGLTSGTKTALHGVVVQNANQSRFEDVAAFHFTSHGVKLDPLWAGLPDGNNNTVKFIGGDYVVNGGDGLHMTLHLDNNNVSFLGVNSSSNGGHGIMVRGEGHLVAESCNIFANALYGVMLSDATDGTFTTNCIIRDSWIEANFSGGVRGGGKSTRCIYYRKNAAQAYTAAAGSTDIYVGATGSGALDLHGNGTHSLQANIAGTTYFLTLQGTGNIDFWVAALGTGRFKPQNDVDIPTGKVYRINGNQIVGARNTGWTAMTGTASKAALATYTAGTTLTFGAAYSQAEMTALATRLAAVEAAVQANSRRMKAYDDALFVTSGHGLIG